MRIACPSCGAAYDVPENRLMPGKPVQCARCGTRWAPLERAPATPEPQRPRLEERLVPEVLAIPEPAPIVTPTVERLTPSPAERSGAGVGLKIAWGLSVVVLAAALWGA